MDLSERVDNVYRHPWELSRTDCILGLLKRLAISGLVLDIGCGDGYFDNCLLDNNNNITELWGVDREINENTYVGRGHWVSSLDMVIPDRFDLILLMDVMEHVEDDSVFFANLIGKLKDNGIIVITVPAFQWLFSLHDKQLKHFRRYNWKQIKYIVETNGMKVTDWSYFYLSLLPGRLMTINKTKNIGNWRYSEEAPMTRTIRLALNIDYSICRFFSRIGLHIWGLSLMAIARK